ncbi:MAG: DUF4129 domain-containing protein [Anaerolineae bacterium]|jgi:hypothetical protein
MKRTLWLLLLALIAAAGLSPPGARAQAAVSLDAYRETVTRARELVAGERPAGAADLLAGVTAVDLPARGTVAVDHGWFVDALRAETPDLEAVAARLEALDDELAAWPAGQVTPGAFDLLAEVLARPEFQPDVAPDMGPLQQWIEDLLARLPRLPRLPWLGRALLGLAVAVVAAVVAYYAAGLWGSFAARAEVEEEALDEESLSAGQARARSQERARAGDFRSAVRLLYLSTLLLLEEQDLLRYDRCLTNREYLRQVAARPGLVERLRPVVDTFDEVWYGQVEPDQARYRAYEQQVARLQEVAR